MTTTDEARSDPIAVRPVVAVIFDCDGVLVDSERLSCAAWLPVLAHLGIRTTLADIQSFIGRSDRALVTHYEQTFGVVLGSDAITARETEYFDAAMGSLRAFPGVRETLLDLRSQGIRVGVASSGTPRKIQFNLEQAGLRELLRVVCSSVEVEHGKPAPDLFQLALQRLGASAGDALVVEDSLPGLEAARRAGIRAIGFTSSHTADELRRAGACAVFDDYAAFPATLKSLHRTTRSPRTW